jgi:hypothetical protein
MVGMWLITNSIDRLFPKNIAVLLSNQMSVCLLVTIFYVGFLFINEKSDR